jgi:excisionase family DNA binding protein
VRDQPPPFVRAQDFAEQRGVSVKTVTRACTDGRIRATKIGRAWLIPRSELDRSTDRQRTESGWLADELLRLADLTVGLREVCSDPKGLDEVTERLRELADEVNP